MSITRVKTGGWAFNEVLTSPQMNAVDINVTNALDKRSGQTDTLGSIITMSSGSQINLSSGSSIGLTSGSSILALSGSTIASGGTVTATGSSVVTLQGTNNISGTTAITGPVTMTGTSLTVFGSGTGQITMGAGTSISLIGNSTLTANSSTTCTFNGTVNVSGGLGNLIFGVNTLTNPNKITFSSSRTFNRVVTNPIFNSSAALGSFYSTSSGILITNTTAQVQADWELNLPQGAVINSFTCHLKGSLGHAGLPSNMPFIALIVTNINTGGQTQLGTISDPASLGVYQSAHFVTSAITPLSVDNSVNKYTLSFASESGTNALANCNVYGFTINYTVFDMDDSK